MAFYFSNVNKQGIWELRVCKMVFLGENILIGFNSKSMKNKIELKKTIQSWLGIQKAAPHI